VEGVKGKRAVEWKLVDEVHPTSQFKEAVQTRAARARRPVRSSRERTGHRAQIR